MNRILLLLTQPASSAPFNTASIRPPFSIEFIISSKLILGLVGR
jgi:hypothetical protein